MTIETPGTKPHSKNQKGPSLEEYTDLIEDIQTAVPPHKPAAELASKATLIATADQMEKDDGEKHVL